MPGSRILLAEDNPTNQVVALAILKRLGLSAQVAPNGTKAVKALRESPFDLVLMDLGMPEMDGLQATRLIRDPGSGVLNSRVTIVAMTAHAMPGDREKCLEAGMDDYLAKPITLQGLSQVLGKWLPGLAGRQAEAPAKAAQGQPEAPVFDLPALRKRLLDDEDLLRGVLASFLQEIPRQITALTELLEAGQAQEAGKRAHAIKGAAAAVCAEHLRLAALGIEKAGRAGELAAVRAAVPGLESQFALARRAILSSSRL